MKSETRWVIVGSFVGTAVAGFLYWQIISARAQNRPPSYLGSIGGNTYIAKDDLFSIALPHKQGTECFKFMEVKEQRPHPDSYYASFSFGYFDSHVFRVDFTKKQHPQIAGKRLEEIVPELMELQREQYKRGYGTSFYTKDAEIIKIHGNKAWHALLPHTLNTLLPKEIPRELLHEVWVIDFKDAIVTVWVETKVTDSRTLEKPLTSEEFVDSLMVPYAQQGAAADAASDGPRR